MSNAMERRLLMEAYCQIGVIPPELWPDARLMCRNKPSWWTPVQRWRWERAVNRTHAFARTLG